MAKVRLHWVDRLLIRVACWCRAHMSTIAAYHCDEEAHGRIEHAREQARRWIEEG